MRYCLKQDQDSHWYLVPLRQETEFESMCSDAYANDEFELFNDMFEDMRVDGPQALSFELPRNSFGDDLPLYGFEKELK